MSVCYISKTVLERAVVGPATSLSAATHLNLQQYRRDSSAHHHPIKRIEKLDLVPRCRHLDLAHNAIERIENLTPLRQLRVLNLADNRIRVIQGLDELNHLTVLDLSGNQISTIPAALAVNRCLTHLRLSRNKIASLDDFHHLASLANLTKLDAYDNPCATLSHSRAFIVFAVPAINVLDGEPVLVADRQAATERFDRHVVQQLQQQVLAITDLHTESLRKLSEAETQLRADQRVLLDLRQQLEAFVGRDEAQARKIRDLDAMLERNASTISKSQSRIAQLEQEALAQQTCARFKAIESGLASQLASERAARIEVENQLADMEKIMNHQLKIARGLLAAKSQRFVMEERLWSIRATDDATPWKAAAQSLLLLCESLHDHIADHPDVMTTVREDRSRVERLVHELEDLHVKRDSDAALRSSIDIASYWLCSRKHRIPEIERRLAGLRLHDARASRSQKLMKLRRVIAANARLRAALASERERSAVSMHSWLRETDSQELELEQRKAALQQEIALMKRHLSDAVSKAKKCQNTQTVPENDSTLATVFACRERALLERSRLLETELEQVTGEVDLLRASSGSRSALKDFGHNICQNLSSLQQARRWALELDACKSQLDERDAQIRYLIGRLKQPTRSDDLEPNSRPEQERSRRSELQQLSAELDSSMSSFKERYATSGFAPIFLVDAADSREKTSRDQRRERDSAMANASDPVPRRLDRFDKERFMRVMERLKEESNI